jgi:UDP-glucose 4-epimerase
MNILLTGGAGYIGSHTAVVLTQAGHQVVLFDNFCNSDKSVLTHLQTICGKALPFVEGDIRDSVLLADTMAQYSIDAVIHFAGLKAVGESVAQPVLYYDNNVGGTISLLQAMADSGVKQLVFSSSATVYGDPQYLPIDEAHPTGATNPYGQTKLHIEHMLQHLAQAEPSWRIISLRYFNPAGAHPSGLICENPSGIPNNLMPYIVRVANGQLQQLQVFGNDYDTPDGTGVRDYIHVVDLAEGHLAAIHALHRIEQPFEAVNLGTGQGYSVLEMVTAFEQANGCQVPYAIVGRRPGDIATCYAKVDKAQQLLQWQAKLGLGEMCGSAGGRLA